MVQKTPTNAGLYDQRIKIEINSATSSDRSSNGAQLENWDDEYFYTLAAYEAMPSRPHGAEFDSGSQRNVEDKALFRLRYDPQTSALDPATCRINVSGKIWNVERVYDPTGKRIEVHLEADSIT